MELFKDKSCIFRPHLEKIDVLRAYGMILPAVESVMCKELTDSVDMGALQERHLSLLLKMNLDSLLRLPSDLEKVGLTVD